MRLPFSKALEDRRLQGDDPWLVVVSVGGTGVRSLSRRMFYRERGVSFVRVPDDLNLDLANWRLFLALDVLLSVEDECTRERLDAVCAKLWSARCCSLWRAYNGYADSQWRAVRLDPLRGSRQHFWGALSWAPLLDAEFRAYLSRARELDLVLRAAPLFSGPEFNEAARDAERAVFDNVAQAA